MACDLGHCCHIGRSCSKTLRQTCARAPHTQNITRLFSKFVSSLIPFETNDLKFN